LTRESRLAANGFKEMACAGVSVLSSVEELG